MSGNPKSRKEHIKVREALIATASDVANWMTESWKRWTVVGRIIPERCNVSLGPVPLGVVGPQGRALLTVHITCSHISVRCVTESQSPSVFQISDMVRNAIVGMVDYISFANRGYYDIVLDTCTSDETGEAWAIPISEPIFDPPRPGYLFTPEASFTDGIPVGAIANDAFATALHDVSQALRYSPRTMEFCRMAVEAVRSHFDPAPDKMKWQERFAAGETAMCDALKIDRKSLRKLEAVAAPGRHGERPYALDWPARKQALELAWEVVKRFQFHLQGVPAEEWQTIE